MKPYLHYSPHYDALTAEEEALLAEDVALIPKAVAATPSLNEEPPYTRNAHATSYGFVRGKVEVVENEICDLSELLGGADLGAILRFSHPYFKKLKTTHEYQVYGCSVKLYNKKVPVSAKFPLVNFPVFITNSVSKFLQVHIRANRYIIAKAKPFSFGIFRLPALAWAGLKIFADRQFFSILRNLVRGLDIEKQFLCTYDYHSIGCFRIGDRMAKIRLRPHYKKKIVQETGLDQRALLQEYFRENELMLEFQAQFATDDKRTPVNNLLKQWKERHSKFVTLARITLPRQDISRYNTLDYENLSFNPFENPDGLKPVGRMQKTRQAIYNASVQARQSLNQTLKK